MWWAFLNLDGSIKPFFNFTLTFENCKTTATCSASLDEVEDNCTIQYGQDSTYKKILATISSPLNTPFNLPLETSTQYYIQFIVTLDSEGVIVKRNFTTGNGKCYNKPINTAIIEVMC